MHFDIADIQRINIGVSEDPFENGSLVPFVRPCDGLCLATVIGIGSCDDTEDGIIVRFCVLEPLENDGPNSICSAVAACRIIECIAVTFDKFSAAGLRHQSERTLHTSCRQKMSPIKTSKVIRVR